MDQLVVGSGLLHSVAMPSASPLGRVAVAVDTTDPERFKEWCGLFGPRVGLLKVGLEAFVRFGPEAVEWALASGAEVFLDLKLHDIPNTVRGAVAAARRLGASYLTVHAGGGRAMMTAAVAAGGGELGILAVTLLTHLDAQTLEELDLPGTAEDRVVRWAVVARETGCAGVVCSPREIGRLRSTLPPPLAIVTPGIRPVTAASDDQRRTATPGAAIGAGADVIVVGRPLTAAPDPVAALDALERELSAP